jgi:dTDP-4-amino-4,6-dideoxygalactose transaminase
MFDTVYKFENAIADFFGAPCAVSTDCCTHAVELCLRYKKIKNAISPKHTYLSIPMTMKKLNLQWQFVDNEWSEYYYITDNIIDAATMWRQYSYIPGTFMCISFQYKKHLSLGRGGVILCEDPVDAANLIKLGYDGRHRNAPWAEQDISSMGYHYYMTPETAQIGLDKLPDAISTIPKVWTWEDYPDLTKMQIF